MPAISFTVTVKGHFTSQSHKYAENNRSTQRLLSNEIMACGFYQNLLVKKPVYHAVSPSSVLLNKDRPMTSSLTAGGPLSLTNPSRPGHHMSNRHIASLTKKRFVVILLSFVLQRSKHFEDRRSSRERTYMMTTQAIQTVASNYAPIAFRASVFDNVQAVGAAWMLSSAVFTTYSTTRFLKYEPQPSVKPQSALKASPLSRATLLTLLRFGGSLALGILAHPNFHVIDRLIETWKLLPTFALPAIFLFVANYTNSISLNRIGISLTYTSKCAIPAITLILTILLDGMESLPSIPALLSLVPIGFGVAAASWNHPSFEMLGFLAALISCASQSALNVTTKRIMKHANVAGPVAQRAMVAVGFVLASAMSLYQIYLQRRDDKEEQETQPPLWLGAMAVAAYHIEYVLSFVFVKMVAPITYSASDAVRRLGIIIVGNLMFGGPAFTPFNIVGVVCALGGALAFSVLNSLS